MIDNAEAILRPLVFGLAAAFFFQGEAIAQGAAQSAVLGERLQLCGSCHGEDGNSKLENIPSLAGQPEFFVANQLFLMREGVRKVDAMADLVKGLKDDEMVALAKHYAALPAKQSEEPIDEALAKRGAELAPKMRCASCHRPDFSGQDQMPRIGRQRVDYLIHSMKEFRDDKRSGADTAMTAVVVGVPDADLAALAHYAASQ